MGELIAIENHGPLIVSTNYWESEAEAAGKVFVSCNAGAIRLLLPRTGLGDVIGEWRTSKYVIVSRGPWPAQQIVEAVELLFEDGSQSPYCLHLTSNSFDMLPAEPTPGSEWVFTAWMWKKGKPHKAFERPAKWRRSAKIPDLKPWE